METKKMTTKYRLTHWAGIVNERAKSGMTVKAYCEAKGIYENTYYYWQHKLRETCQEIINETKEKTEEPITPAGWAICSVSKEAKPSTKPIDIKIGRFHIKATAETDAETLSKVCKVLVSLC